MNNPIEFDLIQRRKALDDWLARCKQRMAMRFPKIDFDSQEWPIKTFYQTPQANWNFSKSFANFASKDISYREAFRCLVAEVVISGKQKDLEAAAGRFRLLASARAYSLFDLTLPDLLEIERQCLAAAKTNPASANTLLVSLSRLAKHVAQLSKNGVLPRLGYIPRAEVRAELRRISNTHQARQRVGKADILDRKMESFNEALNALADNDSRLNSLDRVAIALGARALCAPSRINEILCSSVDDHVTLEDYAQNPIGELDAIHRAHQLLLVTMKGSKGAQWSAKPVLDFMIDTFHYTTNVILEYGKRSRMLVEWYQKHPDKLYLPPELEYLRGGDVSRWILAKIINLTENPNPESEGAAANDYFNELKSKRIKAPNPDTHTKNGRPTSRKVIDFLPWADVEELMLKKVRERLAKCRKVTRLNHYDGDLSKMLFLFDLDETPCFPYAINYQIIKKRFKRTNYEKNQKRPLSIFEKLQITMPVDGKIQIAELDSHDPRRWLTTMALKHGEKLSDVLINNWANRCRLAQLKNYDFRSAEDLAEFSKMPDAPKITELTDLSNGLAAIEKLEDSFGLKTSIITTSHNVGIAMTSMDLIAKATQERPVAKSSRGIIIIYPQRFGVCFHQHHEKPCRNYSNSLATSCITCNEAIYVKGHIPTNDETRKVAKLVFTSIVRHLENLAHTHNRRVADDQEALGEHMLTLVQNGISTASLEDVAIHLVEDFHQMKHLIKDKLFARRLEEAFVTREVVKNLDDATVESGALIKYHNPTQHADPLLEVALGSHGGREKAARDEQELIAKFPQFAPKALNLKDERHLLEPDDDEEDT